jgi:serine/threonine-protein kinase SRPK3
VTISTREVRALLFFTLALFANQCGSSGRLLRIGELFPRTLEQAMANYKIPEADAAHAAAFIRACLHLNPEERSTAVDLLHHPWLETAYICC